MSPSLLAANRPDGIIPEEVLAQRPKWASLDGSDVEGIEHMDSIDDALTVLWSSPDLSPRSDVEAFVMRSDSYTPATESYELTDAYAHILANYKTQHPDMALLEVRTAVQARAVAAAALALADVLELDEEGRR